jgi:DNA-binding transcriptional ArsR family regulator
MLEKFLVSQVRVKILRTMLTRPSEQFHIRGLVREVGTEINAVRRELTNLESAGLLFSRKSGNRVYYTLNTHSTVYPEFLALIAKEYGLGFSIISGLKNLGDVKYAVLSKSFAGNRRKSSSLDVDLFVVGKVNINALEDLVKKEQELRSHEINYAVMGEDEFNYAKRKNDQFVIRVLLQSRIMLIGDEEEFCSLL